MPVSFTKMQGFGNDFVVIRADNHELLSADRIRALGNRRTGIGFDQLLWLEPPRDSGADVYYRIFNADGSEAEQCGNGARCIARFLNPEPGREVVLEHPGGLSPARLEADGNVSVALCEPDFRPAALPFLTEAETPPYRVDTEAGPAEFGIVSIGNPHAVLQVENVDTAPVAALGPLLESHAQFPNRANIGFMQIVAADRIRLRVFERGVGETQACGTGACAAVVVGRNAGIPAEQVQVDLPGGQAIVRWNGPGTPVWLTGEAKTVYEGTVNL